jgi:hypothetical protein
MPTLANTISDITTDQQSSVPSIFSNMVSATPLLDLPLELDEQIIQELAFPEIGLIAVTSIPSSNTHA